MRSSWLQAIYDCLATGPKAREEVVVYAMGHVPPGIAYRHRQRKAAASKALRDKRRGGPPMQNGGVRPGDAWLVGSRQLVGATLAHCVKRGSIIKDDAGLYRLPPKGDVRD